MTQSGQAFELQMPEHHTNALESLLLRSPTASQGQGGALGEAEARKRGNTVGIRDQAMDLAKLQGHKVSREVVNLPTPTTQDGKNNGGPSQFNRNTKPLNTEVLLLGTPRANAANSSSNQVELGAPKSRLEDRVLLPTPTVAHGLNKTSGRQEGSNHHSGPILNDVAYKTDWGKFEPAIRRWESIIGRPAPEPTKPDGKDNNHRLSSKFTEWMMGLPDGWITGHGLKRNDELKLAGNGVVPQQAELALRLLLDLPEIRER
jgi:DNA (cytosine-5)-methyltransferase 1